MSLTVEDDVDSVDDATLGDITGICSVPGDTTCWGLGETMDGESSDESLVSPTTGAERGFTDNGNPDACLGARTSAPTGVVFTLPATCRWSEGDTGEAAVVVAGWDVAPVG